jgi:hypothetical protein
VLWASDESGAMLKMVAKFHTTTAPKIPKDSVAVYNNEQTKQTKMFMKRFLSTKTAKMRAPPLVYIAGEEMSRWAGELFLNEWIRPHVDTSAWEFFDLSCKSRDTTNDKVLYDCISAGKRIGAIYKEPTMQVTPERIFFASNPFLARQQKNKPKNLV